MHVIPISGHAQNGKDTTAKIIADFLESEGHKVLITHYGDLVKFICRNFFGWDGKKDERGRSILQYVGTDIVRNEDKTYWVRFIRDMLTFFGDNWEYVLIPDTRFPNEVTYLADNGFDVTHIRVERANFNSPLTAEQQSHASETALDDTVPDYLLLNDGTIDELKGKIKNFIKETLYGNE